jgi:hypothetical protein
VFDTTAAGAVWEAAGTDHDPPIDQMLQPDPAFEFDQPWRRVADVL